MQTSFTNPNNMRPLLRGGDHGHGETREFGSVLYVTFDGLTDPLGRSQVLPYLIGLSARGYRITILSLEKPERFERDAAAIRQICAAHGLAWEPLPYHRAPPLLSSMFDAAALKRAAGRLHRRSPFDMVHCRSYIPAMAGLELKRRFGVPFLFDMRGFWPDERVEGGSWSLANPIYRQVYAYFKKLEAKLLREAGHIISLTHAGKEQLLTRPQFRSSGPDITVIPCCVDVDHFPLIEKQARAAARSTLSISPDAKVVAYLGSVGSWYLLEEMLDFFRTYQRHHADAVFLFVTPDDPNAIVAKAKERGIGADRLVIRSASREEVPQLMAAADFGLFFIKPCFSKIASSPTKMGEILALGLPVITNAGVGDVAAMVNQTGCGVAIEHFDEASYEAAIATLETLPYSAEQLREIGKSLFDIKLGFNAYEGVYRSLVPTTDRSTSTIRGA